MKTQILVVGHKKFHKPLFKKEYKKIFVGPNQGNLASSNDYRDSSGDNIAEKNANYNEMTAIYWAWKNLDLDNYGFCHYRRFLKYNGKLLNKKTIEQLLQKYEVILPTPEELNDTDKTNENHYLHVTEHNDVELLRKIIIRNHGSWLEPYNHIMSLGSGHYRNSFVMNRKAFNSYCNFIFPLLEELEEVVPNSEINGLRTRMFGYMSEKLLDVWLEINHVTYCEVGMIFNELGIKRVVNKARYLLGKNENK